MDDVTSDANFNCHDYAIKLAQDAYNYWPKIASASTAQRNAVLTACADLLSQNTDCRAEIINANRIDLDNASQTVSGAMLNRLILDAKELDQAALGLRQIASLPDPVEKVIDGYSCPNGLRLRRVRVPLGVLLMIYESRPNVTIDAWGLAIKSGNAVILRGGKEALNSNLALGRVISQAMRHVDLPECCCPVVAYPGRELIPELLSLDNYIDLTIPRGGKGLVSTVMQYAKMPVLKHLEGICHVYVHRAADLELAYDLVLNAKLQRPATCNAMETLLVDAAIASDFLPRILAAFNDHKVIVHADALTLRYAEAANLKEKLTISLATAADYATEYNDLEANIAIVDNIDAALMHIRKYSSKHTDAIVTGDIDASRKFTQNVDSSSVMVNVSTRLSDGFEYGLGAEIGISTDKLHARGPVGLEGLTTYKWLVEGDGVLRK